MKHLRLADEQRVMNFGNKTFVFREGYTRKCQYGSDLRLGQAIFECEDDSSFSLICAVVYKPYPKIGNKQRSRSVDIQRQTLTLKVGDGPTLDVPPQIWPPKHVNDYSEFFNRLNYFYKLVEDDPSCIETVINIVYDLNEYGGVFGAFSLAQQYPKYAESILSYEDALKHKTFEKQFLFELFKFVAANNKPNWHLKYQYSVASPLTRYLVDYALVGHDRIVLIEYDEDHHAYQELKDQKRQAEIVDILSSRYDDVRFFRVQKGKEKQFLRKLPQLSRWITTKEVKETTCHVTQS